MKAMIFRVAALFLALGMILPLAACGSNINVTETPTAELQGSKTAEAEITDEGKEPEARETGTKPAEKEDDGVVNVLLFGSSFGYRFPDELCAMAEQMGVQMRVYHAYSSGLYLETQWKWFRSGTGEYEPNIHKTSDAGLMRTPAGNRAVDYLTLYDWDVICIYQTPMGFRTGDVEDCRKGCNVYAKAFYEFLRERCPGARYMWYQVWGINVGYTVEDASKCIPNREKQLAMHNAAHIVAREVAEANKADLIPAGDAWEIIRSETDIGDRLTGRNGDEYGDNLHDGDTGGGQYLNACVWFEVLFQKSCVGNTWRPTKYTLDEAKIPLLQEAAHRAVAEYWGEDYAK